MASYISSNDNRFYCNIESSFGVAPAITSANRFLAVKLSTQQEVDLASRKDKTGSRTFAGIPNGARKKTSFGVKTYMGSWSENASQPSVGPLVQAALGATPLLSPGGTVSAVSNPTHVGFSSPHGLSANQAISFDGDIRFVASVVDASNVVINAPFTTQLSVGAQLTPTITYRPATTLPSISLYDYWDPITALQRIIVGAAVDKMSLTINNDYHEFDFSGVAKDIVDSSSFASGDGGLNAFQLEPSLGGFDLSVVPGNLGQAWLGASPQQFLTITSASLLIENSLQTRSAEFGSSTPLAVSPGNRFVSLSLSLFEKDDGATMGLYQAARQRSPIGAMFQLGQSPGQLFGVYLSSVVPELPELNDSDTRLQWTFSKSKAQGVADDEISVAFA